MNERQKKLIEYVNAIKSGDTKRIETARKALTEDDIDNINQILLHSGIDKDYLTAKRNKKKKQRKFFLNGVRGERIKSLENELKSWGEILVLAQYKILPMDDTAIKIMKFFMQEIEEELNALKDINTYFHN